MDREFEKCKWCNGTGNGATHIMDTPYACTDCEGTGLKGGKSAVEEMDKAIEEEYQKHRRIK